MIRLRPRSTRPDHLFPSTTLFRAVEDHGRIAFLEEHLAARAEARDAGADVRGYFPWSLMDGFEWAEGHAPRFGLVHVDHATGRRTPKASFRWYAALASENRF